MSLIEPHGGELVDLMVNEARAAELKEVSRDWPSWDLTARQLNDLELLLTGAFSPLRGFLGESDYASVRDDMRLAARCGRCRSRSTSAKTLPKRCRLVTGSHCAITRASCLPQ